MAPQAQAEFSLFTWGRLELQKNSKFWLSWPQYFTALAPSQSPTFSF